MRNYTIIIVCVLLSFLTNDIQAQNKKLAQTGMKFLSVSTDARSSGIAEAITSIDISSASAMFYNPSTMASIENLTSLSVGNVGWIADINYLHGAIAFAPFQGDYGVFGLSFVSVDYGELQGTIVANNEQGYIDVGGYSPTAFAFGLGYAKELSEKFAVGGNVKYVRQDLGSSVIDVDDTGNLVREDNSLDAVSFDFGIFYRTGFKSLNFGMSVRNFSTELEYKEESFQLPLTFKIGLSMDLIDLTSLNKDVNSFVVSVDASHPRDFSEQIFVGGEYTFIKTFALRAGYVTPADEHGFTAGFGVKQEFASMNVGLDYAYQPFGIFDDVHRFSFNFSF